MNSSDKEALRRHLESLNLYGRELRFKDVENLIRTLNNAGEGALADLITSLDHFTVVNEFIKKNIG